MAAMFTNLSWWSWSGKNPEPSSISTGELETLNSSVNEVKMQTASRRIKRKWQSREERKIDREFDVVLIPSDGGCLSGSESDSSDWSIGWTEPLAPSFQTNDEMDSSFAVLVPCYGNKSRGFLEQWLSSLENS
ncbi:hypothetical protein AQUCO_00700499v1 [Aquilegia coerulea]|uniref:Uncharacterized protein n=1 Tax=Aquilegia coerulea TaxID=218851 RepID=A0A2G5EKA1_AQUCA|nr:hypothetical protein AQUCO_00700499v1 [Aquilegia coerulea]